MSEASSRPAHFAVLAVCLGAIAWASPLPQRVTDSDIYQATAAQGVVMDCSDIHCFRVLVPWLLGPLPGSSIVKWKIYAVVCNAAAAVEVRFPGFIAKHRNRLGVRIRFTVHPA